MAALDPIEIDPVKESAELDALMLDYAEFIEGDAPKLIEWLAEEGIFKVDTRMAAKFWIWYSDSMSASWLIVNEGIRKRNHYDAKGRSWLRYNWDNWERCGRDLFCLYCSCMSIAKT